MSNNELLTIEPKNLRFLYGHESTKRITRSLYLTNLTNNNVKATHPNHYSVRPSTGVILRRSSLQVLVTRESQKEAPADTQSNESFLIQSVNVVPGVTASEVTREMFNKELGHLVEETKLRISYVNSTGKIIPGPSRFIDRRCLTDFG